MAVAGSVYLGLLQRHFFSYRYLLYTLLIFIMAAVLTGWINHKIILPSFSDLPKKIRLFLILFSILLSAVLLFNTKIQPLYYALPDTRLEIRFTVPALPEGSDGVHLLWVETGQWYVHYTTMEIIGDWERPNHHLMFFPDQAVRIFWTGKVGRSPEIAFRQTAYDQEVEVIWNGRSQMVNLNNPTEPNIFIRSDFDISVICLLPYILSFLLSTGYGLFVLLILLGSWEPSRRSKPVKTVWLFYMLPMLAAWTFTLLVFWPGIMSNDSLAQWGQGATGSYNDWQSAFHALLLGGLMRVWYSPAVVSILQIFSFALVAAWGLKTFESLGVPKGVLWGISLLFALFPPDLILSVTLWKDVAYAVAFLWLTIILVSIVTSRGAWVRKLSGWISLGVAAFLVSVFRQNGTAVALLSLVLLPLIFRKHWKPLAAGLAVSILLFNLAKGPLYDAIAVDRSATGQSNLIYLHHIAAHLDAGTEFDQADLAYLETFMPLEEWEYSCCYVGTISYDGEFDRSSFLTNTERNRELALRLFSRNPLVDVSHGLCAGELSWKFASNQCYMKSTHGINRWFPGKVDWIGRNPYDINNKSLLPGFVDPYVSFLRVFGFLDDELVFYLRPAFWMYIGALSVSAAVIRRRNLELLAVLLPLFAQAAVLLLISFAPAYRYHFGSCLAGMMLAGMLFLPKEKDA